MLSFDVRAFDASADADLRVLIACCGYEARAVHAAKSLLGQYDRLWFFEYDQTSVLSYDENYETLSSMGSSINWDSEVVAGGLVGRLRTLFEGDLGIHRIGVDVSSFDRDRMSLLVRLLLQGGDNWDVIFLYSPAVYDPLLTGSEGPVEINRPARGAEGWTADPSLPSTCILGLGFEGQMALAAVESLEPNDLYLFQPEGIDGRNDEIVDERNAVILGSTPTGLLSYRLDQPLTTFRSIEQLVHSSEQSSRVVIVPVGPKVFALAAFVVAAGFDDRVMVWRVSSGQHRIPEQRQALGNILGLDVRVRLT